MMRGYILATAGLLCLGSTSALDKRQITAAAFFTDNNSMGGSFASHAASSSNACYTLCVDTANCVSFTYSETSGICYLKDETQCLKESAETITTGFTTGYLGGTCGSISCSGVTTIAAGSTCELYSAHWHSRHATVAKRDQLRLNKQLAQAYSAAPQVCARQGLVTCNAALNSRSSVISGRDCVDVLTDFENCGGCGYDCGDHISAGAEEASCVAGQCVVTSCLPGYTMDNKGECRYRSKKATRTNRRSHGVLAHRAFSGSL